MSTAVRIRTFKDLVVWQKAMELSVQIYRLTKNYPADERYGLTAETPKTSRSVPYNIAEGHKRSTTVDYIRFLNIAAGSVESWKPNSCLPLASDIFRKIPPRSYSRSMRKWNECSIR